MALGIVLNTYKRQDYFLEQFKAVVDQTVRPDRLIVHRNDSWDDSFFSELLWASKDSINNIDWVKSRTNAGVYRRFCLGLDLETDYVLFIDDDTIPGIEYVSNVMKQHDQVAGLYSAAGFRLNHRNYDDRSMFGWISPENCRVRTAVDWPGHSWFMHKSVLIHAYDLPRYPDSNLCGEDMRLAFAAQDLGLRSYVTPYYEDTKTWGSLFGRKGVDSEATWRLPNQKNNMHKAMNFYRNRGWKFMSEL